MPVTTDIFATYRAPRKVLRRHLAMGEREDRALMFLMVACILILVAQLPRLSREAALDETADLAELATGEIFVWLIVMPLFLYGLAAASRLVAKLFGGRGTWYRARVALFWSLLASTPLWLLRGLVAGFVGPGAALEGVTLLALGIFAILWFTTLREAERGLDPNGEPHEA